jgi:type II secretory pathway pseudopilin PulG
MNAIIKTLKKKWAEYLLEVLVIVVSILGAFALEQWSENMKEQKELDDLMKSVASGIESDIASLRLTSQARMVLGDRIDSVFNSGLINNDLKTPEQAAFITQSFKDITNIISVQPNTGAYDALKNSGYLGKLQGTDIEFLLSTYHNQIEQLKIQEQQHNQVIGKLVNDWTSNIEGILRRDFLESWRYTPIMLQDLNCAYYTTLENKFTIDILIQGFNEFGFIKPYEDLILLGAIFNQMIDEGVSMFDDETKTKLSSILPTYTGNEQITLISNGIITSGAFILDHANSNPTAEAEVITHKPDNFIFFHDGNRLNWSYSYFRISALHGRIRFLDFSRYSTMLVELRSDKMGQQAIVIMKDIDAPTDGSEKRVKFELSTEWKTYRVSIAEFGETNFKRISEPFGLLF